MTQLFEIQPVRLAAPRGRSSVRIRHSRTAGRWPPPDRDPVDAALVAARLLRIGGRIRTRLRAAARAGGVEPQLVALLLLFAESNGTLRVIEIAELLGIGRASASQLTTRAEAAGLVDKFSNPIDEREVDCRLSLAGRIAATRCLDSLRPIAAEMLGDPDREWLQQARDLLGRASRVPLMTRNSGWRAGVRAGGTIDG